MNSVAQEMIQEAAAGSNEGRLHFGQVIALLAQAGVQSCFADYRAERTTYYGLDGSTLGVPVEMPDDEIALRFNAEGLKAAIRGAQQGRVMYPEFKRLSRQAGCIGYMVWLTGRHVTYFGRKGETHVEAFPD